MKSLTMSVTKIRPFLKVFENKGISLEEALRGAGVNPLLIESPDNRITAADINRIIELALRITEDESIGLKLGARLNKGFSNILGYILMNCADLREGLQKYRKYEKVLDQTSVTSAITEGNLVILTMKIIDPFLAENRQYCDYKVAGTYSYLKLLTGEKIVLKEVWLTHSKPKDVSSYEEVFHCPVLFDKTELALVLDREILNLPVCEPNRELLTILEQRITEIFRMNYEDPTRYTNKVKKIILRDISRNAPTLDKVAKELAVSVRSLQMYLKSEGTTYTKLLNEIQEAMAIDYLADRKLSIDEIAYILGFTERSTFHKAFKKWTNFTPGEYREIKRRNKG